MSVTDPGRLWRVRATLEDRPGALASLTEACGRAGANILTLHVFPGAGGQARGEAGAVTDELVLEAPDGWSEIDVESLLVQAGGRGIVVARCGPSALVDQPTRFVAAARSVLAQPATFPDLVARLFDADAVPAGERSVVGGGDEALDLMELSVGEVQVQIRRRAPFTAVEHARGEAMAELVSDVLGRARPPMASGSNRRMGAGATPEYVPDPITGTVSAVADGATVGVAVLGPAADGEPGVRTLEIEVDPAWQRRGIGSRLLGDGCRLARGLGASEVVIAAGSDNRAVLPMVLSAGMRGRIRMAGDVLSVRIGVVELRPLG